MYMSEDFLKRGEEICNLDWPALALHRTGASSGSKFGPAPAMQHLFGAGWGWWLMQLRHCKPN